MDKELIKSLDTETSEKLFYLFKHDGAINFEKKIIAGNLLHKRGFDTTKLSSEKEIIVASIRNELKMSESSDYLEKKSRKDLNKNLYFWLSYAMIFLSIEIVDHWDNLKNFEFNSHLIIILTGLIFFTYRAVTYKKELSIRVNSGIKNNELLIFRLRLIEREWNFQK